MRLPDRIGEYALTKLRIPVVFGKAAKNSDAVIEMFNGGDLGGLCVAELIAGRWNPSGKLPISFPRSSAQIPAGF